jgi:hypothetical protein
MTAQQLHDLEAKGARPKPGSRKLLEEMLKKKSKSSDNMSQSQPLDEIGWAMKRFPGLTREKAEAIVAMQGF